MRLPWAKPANAASDEIARLSAQVETLRAELLRVAESGVMRYVATDAPIPANNANAMLAGTPTAPGPSKQGIYAYDQPYRYTVPQAPYKHPDSLLTVQVLRRVADVYDVLRSCIQHLKREAGAVPLGIVARDEADKTAATERAIEQAIEFFGKSGGLGGRGRLRSEFEGMVIEDLCIVGAAAIHYQPSRLGLMYEVQAIDAATIRPRVDAYGWPGPGEEVYEQWIYGVKVAGYTREELAYEGLSTHARSYSPYFASPVEWLINVITAAMKADEWNRSWLTDGNTPGSFFGAPEAWTPDQITQFQTYLDALLTGDTKERQRIRVVPSTGKNMAEPSRKDQDFQEYELWLLRRTCACLGVQPASIGFAGEQYKVSQEDSMESTSAFGVGVILDWRKTIYDDLLERIGFPELECRNVIGREEQAMERATRNVALVGGGIKSPNEARQDEGLDPIEGGDDVMVQNTMMPLSQVMAMAQAQQARAQMEVSGEGDLEGELETERDPDTKGGTPSNEPKRAHLAQWERKALNRIRAGKRVSAAFESDELPRHVREYVSGALPGCETVAEVRRVFDGARERLS